MGFSLRGAISTPCRSLIPRKLETLAKSICPFKADFACVHLWRIRLFTFNLLNWLFKRLLEAMLFDQMLAIIRGIV